MYHMEIEKLFAEQIAHAYIFYKSDLSAVLAEIEKKTGFAFGGNQNAMMYEVESFGIDDSRAVTELGNLQSEGESYVAIVARSIGAEAQHALLKTVEEPRRGVHYFIFVENPEMLLPTLRSRAIVVQKMSEVGNKSKHPDFLVISLADRFAYIEKLAKNLKKDDPNAFRDAAMEIFDAVMMKLRDNAGDGKKLSRILELRNFLSDRGSSAKQLLETMAMQL